MQELIQAGFIQEDIDLSNRRIAGDNTNYSDTTSDNEGIGDKIGNFFSSLFDDETTASNYTNAAYDADAILTVQADSEERARAAADILDRNGAMDVDENGSAYGDTYGSANDLSQNYAGTGSATDMSGRMNTTDTSATMNTTGTTGYDETTSNQAIFAAMWKTAKSFRSSKKIWKSANARSSAAARASAAA